MKDKCIASTENGQVLFCSCCGVLHLEYGNIHMPMWIEQMVEMWMSLKAMKAEECEKINRNNLYRRKLMVPIKNTQLSMLFSSKEIAELGDLMQQAIDVMVLPTCCQEPKRGFICSESKGDLTADVVE